MLKYCLIFISIFQIFLNLSHSYGMPLESGEGFVTSSDGTQLFYKVVGSGPERVVVIHGGPGNTLHSILPDLEPLARTHTIIYYDQRGNGRSALVQKPDALTISRHVEDLEAIRNYFTLKEMTLIGFSWGGLLASYYAVSHPENIKKMVLISAAPVSIQRLRKYAGFIHQRIPLKSRNRFNMLSDPGTWSNASDPRRICGEFYAILTPVYFHNPASAEKMRGDTCSGSDEALRQQQVINKLIWHSLGEWNIQPRLSAVRIPTLVIQGDNDMIPVESSFAWAEALPNARLLIIENAGHMTHIEQPDIFFTAVEDFLNNKWPVGSITVNRRPLVSDAGNSF